MKSTYKLIGVYLDHAFVDFTIGVNNNISTVNIVKLTKVFSANSFDELNNISASLSNDVIVEIDYFPKYQYEYQLNYYYKRLLQACTYIKIATGNQVYLSTVNLSEEKKKLFESGLEQFIKKENAQKVVGATPEHSQMIC